MTLSIISNDERRKAVVSETEDGSLIRYFRSTEGLMGSGWRFDRECCPKLPFHAACDLAVQMLNHRPPEIGNRAR